MGHAPERGELRRAKKNYSHHVRVVWFRVQKHWGEHWLSQWTTKPMPVDFRMQLEAAGKGARTVPR